MNILADDLRPIDDGHVGSHLIGYGSTNHSLACARRPVQEDSSGGRDACMQISCQVRGL